jgi:hypothetical protein
MSDTGVGSSRALDNRVLYKEELRRYDNNNDEGGANLYDESTNDNREDPLDKIRRTIE